MKKLLELFGWYGTAAIIGGYALISFGVLEPDNLWYQVLNLTGAVGITLISFYKGAQQPGVLNTIWSLIATVAIFKILVFR